MPLAELFAEVTIVAGLVIGGAWLIWIMRRATDDLRMHGSFGDVPQLPDDATKPPCRNRAGDDAAGGTGAVHSHSGTPSQRPRGSIV